MQGSGNSNVDLIWTVSELSGLFEKRTNMGGFLQDVVELIASHLHADVCSVYLYDEDADALVLRATKGLNPDSVGRVQLNLGEGITGRALKELRPIREARASKSPHFKLIPETEEDPYESFLAVPIKRGLNRIGVMVVQHRKPDFFDMQDTRALQAIASHLAATLENVEILMEVHGQTAVREQGEASAVSVIRGKTASAGLARGRSVSFGGRTQLVRAAHVESRSGEAGVEQFRRALDATQQQLEQLQLDVGEDLADVASLIFSSHLLMLRDTDFTGRIEEEIVAGIEPAEAITRIVNEYVELFSNSGNERTREKTQDIKDLGHRLIRNLSGAGEEHGDYAGQIVIASELFPSELVKMALQEVEGIVLQDGGLTAHISILARSLGLPVLLTKDERILQVRDDSELILDADQAVLYVDPDEQVIETFEANLEMQRSADVDPADIPDEAVASDGERIAVHTNINIFQDVRSAKRFKAEGIGLYRSEFPFIVRSDFPSEDEQYHIYRRVIKSLSGKEVVLRTLDIGGDKLLPQPGLTESNPFLGFRGIRFSLANRELFKEQLRAMLRAGYRADLHIMFPMISALDEFRQAREVVRECSAELTAEEVPHNEEPKLGAMIELPAAVECVGRLSREADFLSIGTNDLVMYMLAVDRTNDRVGFMYKHYHPAVLHTLQRIMDNTDEAASRVSMCGEAASDPLMVPFLLGIGIRRLSVEPKELPRIKQRIAGLTMSECESVAKEMLSCSTVEEVERYLGVGKDSDESDQQHGQAGAASGAGGGEDLRSAPGADDQASARGV